MAALSTHRNLALLSKIRGLPIEVVKAHLTMVEDGFTIETGDSEDRRAAEPLSMRYLFRGIEERKVRSPTTIYRYRVRTRTRARARGELPAGGPLLEPTGDPGRMVELVKRYRGRPTRAVAMEVYRLFKEGSGPVDATVLVGGYLTLYQGRLKTAWGGRLDVLGRMMSTLLKQHGERALEAVELVMGSQFDWVEGDRLHFVTNTSTFSRFVAPKLVRRRGEQAEWTSSRSPTLGSRKEQL